MDWLKQGETDKFLAETPLFATNGAMVDMSRNAVMNVKTVKEMLRRMALMGLNTYMLYTEDSFDLPTRPHFGYMRPRYTEQQLRELDDYADMFGIEMIPCIQTLAHLQEVLKWNGVYGGISDYEACLLVNEEKTYEFIRRVITSATRPFRTKRVHIGMDEAFMLGREA